MMKIRAAERIIGHVVEFIGATITGFAWSENCIPLAIIGGVVFLLGCWVVEAEVKDGLHY